MKKAALYVHGKIVIGCNHGEAFGKLTEVEQEQFMISGFYNPDTKEFESDSVDDHFYDKNMYLIRHGQVQDQCNPDTQISDEGAEQAEKLGSYLLRTLKLKEYTFFTSPLLRCLQTAQILHQFTNMPFFVSPEVMETPQEEFCLENHKEEFPEFDWPTSHNWNLVPEAEETFLCRIRQTLHGLPHKAIIVTHFGTIFNMARLTSCDHKASAVFQEGLPPASVISINKNKMERLKYEDNS